MAARTKYYAVVKLGYYKLKIDIIVKTAIIGN